MAKLSGVKTIDMVNGEITKVSYDGAEYALVDEKAVAGDLIQMTNHAYYDVTSGEFYKVERINARDKIVMYDDVNDSHTWRRKSEMVRVFRKISAQTPTSTIEERVEELEAEVAKLKAQQTEETIVKAESKPKLKAGDFVKITRKRSWYTPGKLYEVITDIDGELAINDDWNDENGAPLRAGEYVLVSAEEVAKHRESEKWSKIGRKVNEYKVGDIIEWGSFGNFKEIPEYRKVVEIDGDIVRFYDNSYGNKTEFTYSYSKSIRLVAPVESLV